MGNYSIKRARPKPYVIAPCIFTEDGNIILPWMNNKFQYKKRRNNQLKKQKVKQNFTETEKEKIEDKCEPKVEEDFKGFPDTMEFGDWNNGQIGFDVNGAVLTNTSMGDEFFGKDANCDKGYSTITRVCFNCGETGHEKEYCNKAKLNKKDLDNRKREINVNDKLAGFHEVGDNPGYQDKNLCFERRPQISGRFKTYHNKKNINKQGQQWYGASGGCEGIQPQQKFGFNQFQSGGQQQQQKYRPYSGQQQQGQQQIQGQIRLISNSNNVNYHKQEIHENHNDSEDYYKLAENFDDFGEEMDEEMLD